MFVNFTEEARKILMLAKKEMYELKHEYIGTEHVLLAIMCIPNKVRKKLEEKGLTYKKIKDEIVDALGIGEESKDLFIYTPLLKRVIESSVINAKENVKKPAIKIIILDFFFKLSELAHNINAQIVPK